MLTKEGCLTRRARLWNAVPSDVEWLLIADPRHVKYLANFWIPPFSFSGGERALLLLERDGKATLLGDNFSLKSSMCEAFVDAEVVEKWYDHQHSVANRDHVLFRAVSQVASKLKGRIGAVESEWLPVGALDAIGDGDIRLSNISLGTELRTLRRRKEPDEIALLEQCMRATDVGQAWARANIKPGMTELDVFRGVQSASLAAAGRAGLIYGDFRVTNGTSPKAGGLPTQHKLQNGELFVLDYSLVLEGYRSDFTNVIAIGTPSSEQREVFAICQRAMAAAEKTLKAGARAADVFAAASAQYVPSSFAAKGYDHLTHHAGHGIGLAHPEAPILVPQSEDVLVAGDVLTLEPGLYVEGVGGVRIEHNYLITETGYRRLSNHIIALD
ncbi:MAG: peptidase M24 [Planctomycetota bacterium]|nr:MAG: peptidase M24 [Planctomycetota bacterium]